jgi:hypothetical protein
MQLRFRQTTPSLSPDRPFQPGQVITISKLTAEMRRWLKDGMAELVPEVPEVADRPAGERAIVPPARERDAQ